MLAPLLRSRRALGAFLSAAVCLLLAGPALASSVTVSSTPVGRATPESFLGISLGFSALPRFTGADPSRVSPAFLHLLGDIAPGQQPVLRIGGDSTDMSWVPVPGLRRPAGDRFAITPRWLKLAAATAGAIHGRLVLGLNLEAANRAATIHEARTFVRDLGASRLLALELGNEPELYHHFAWYRSAAGAAVLGRGPDWSLSRYHAQFAQFAHALPRGVTIAGPTSGIGIWLRSLAGTLRAEPKIGLVTIHAYPLKHCSRSHVVTIPEMLASSSSAGFAHRLAAYVRIAHADGKPIRIDEMNAITCGGTHGVSDSMASALWMMKTLFGLDRIGADGINLNVPMGSANAVLAPIRSHGRIAFHVQPEYYAMIMFARAAPPGSQIMRLHGTLARSLSAWATRTTSGSVHVVIVNQSASSSASVRVRVPGAVGTGAVSLLHGPSLTATGGVRLDGQSFGAVTSTGLLSPGAQPTVSAAGGSYVLRVPAASVEMLSLTLRRGALLTSALRSRRGLLSTLVPAW